MVYLKNFYFASGIAEDLYLDGIRRTCYDSFYPFMILPQKGIDEVEFKDVTILYGGNGSGKSTMLNIIAEKIGAERLAPYNRSNFYEDYLGYCDFDYANAQMEEKLIITSDDIFDYMLDIRRLNEGIDTKREERLEEYLDYKYNSYQLKSIDDIDELRKRNAAKSQTQSKYIRKTLMDNVREYSNGESAYRYFTNKIKENSIYILDEPENSLSPELQLELVKFLELSVRAFRCQFIIATHSPFILSLKDALVYDLDKDPAGPNDWHKLKNVQAYYKFFMDRKEEFEEAIN